MSGEELHALYVREWRALGVESDSWEDIGDEQAVWEALAEKLVLASECE